MQHKHTAQGLASLGRGPDTELVHMTKGEVHGLQKLAMAHGGSLTINPHTGLPEAGFLSSLLPMLVGAGLSIASGGALTPLMAAGLMGGGTALATGSLQKGLMAGLGAYGGAGLAGGLMGAGAIEAAGGAMAGAPAAVADTVATTGVSGAPTLVNQTAANAASAAELMPHTISYPADNFLNVSQSQLNPLANTQIGAPITPMPTVQPLQGGLGPTNAAALRIPELSPYEQMIGGFKDVTSSGAKALSFAKDNAYPLGAMGLSALGNMGPTKLNAPPVSSGMIRPYTFERTQNEIQPQDRLNALYTPGQSSRERDYFKDRFTALTPYAAPGPEYPKMADGGEVAAYKYDPTTQTYSGGADTSANEDYAYTFDPNTGLFTRTAAPALGATNAFYGGGYDSGGYGGDAGSGVSGGVSGPGGDGNTGSAGSAADGTGDGGPGGVGGWAQGGITALAHGGASHLGDYSDGGQLLRGPGDGVSDSIPAMIGQKQQARLADGEFVVPARIVSELGNGSTEAGARQLYAMMDRVQKARKKSVGKDKVATNTKASRLLPA